MFHVLSLSDPLTTHEEEMGMNLESYRPSSPRVCHTIEATLFRYILLVLSPLISSLRDPSRGVDWADWSPSGEGGVTSAALMGGNGPPAPLAISQV